MVERIVFEVYRRGGRYYIAVGMNRPGVDWASLPEVIPVQPTVESVAAAFRDLEPRIRKVFAEAPKPWTNDYTDADYEWEQMGAKNRTQFMRSTSFCMVDMPSDQIEIWYMLNNPQFNLFTGSGEEPDAKLGPGASYEDIARAVLEVFEKNPPPAGDKPDSPKRLRKSASAKQ